MLRDSLQMHRSTFDPLLAMTYPLAQSHLRPDSKTFQVQHRYAEHTGHHPSGYAISTLLDLPEQEAEPERREREGANWSRSIGSYLGRLGLAKVSRAQDHLLLDLNGEACALHAYNQDIFFGTQPSGEKKRVIGFVPEEE